MKQRLRLVSLCFLALYTFTNLTWEVGQFLANRSFFRHFRTQGSWLSEGLVIAAFLLCTIIAYLTFYIVYYKWKQKMAAVFCHLFLSIPIMILCRYVLEEVIGFALTGRHNYSDGMRAPLRYFIDNIYFVNYYSACGIVFFFVQLSAYNQRKEQALIIENRNAELSFLRSQVNPHFLFNSLNNIYTLVYQQSSNALPAISRLSDLLRYMLYEKEERVPLKKELEYLHNFIELQLIRYNFEVCKEVDLPVFTPGRFSILPFTLITFVENAFKHGNLKEPSCPLHLSLSLEENCFVFYVSNLVGHFEKDGSGGIGLENIKKRLALAYGDRHKLEITNNGKIFTVKLTIVST